MPNAKFQTVSILTFSFNGPIKLNSYNASEAGKAVRNCGKSDAKCKPLVYREDRGFVETVWFAKLGGLRNLIRTEDTIDAHFCLNRMLARKVSHRNR